MHEGHKTLPRSLVLLPDRVRQADVPRSWNTGGAIHPRVFRQRVLVVGGTSVVSCRGMDAVSNQPLDVISNQVVHSEPLRKNGGYHTNPTSGEEAPSEASS